MSTSFNCCPRQQCRGLTTHSTLRHWTPVYLCEVAYIVKAHALGECYCRNRLLVDLARHTGETLAYFVREARRWIGYRVLHRDW